MLREWPYTASSRDASGNTSPSDLEISLGRGFCTWRNCPRTISRAPLGNLGPREMHFPIYPSSWQIQSASSVPTDKSMIARRLRGCDVKYSGFGRIQSDSGEKKKHRGPDSNYLLMQCLPFGGDWNLDVLSKKHAHEPGLRIKAEFFFASGLGFFSAKF